MYQEVIQIYTDGSCHLQSKRGGWAAIILLDGNTITLKGIVQNATHNQMELKAVVNAIDYLKSQRIGYERIDVYTDSQYVVNLTQRKTKLQSRHFLTKKGLPIRNIQLVRELIIQLENAPVNLIKVTAHQKPTGAINYNREVDLLVRRMVRQGAG